ncbi:MAG: nuclear transport factor 2 family protein [Allosphingosinicella sp.]
MRRGKENDMCWRLILILLFALVLVTPAAAATPAASAQTPDEVAVLAADERQREAVAAVDLPAIAAISHPDLLINAPNNRVITRDDLIRMVGSGEIRNEIFERVPETVSVTGDVAIVMGHETVFPGADSEQARMYGRRTLNRRYTNVYLRVAGTWLHLARHANVLR